MIAAALARRRRRRRGQAMYASSPSGTSTMRSGPPIIQTLIRVQLLLYKHVDEQLLSAPVDSRSNIYTANYPLQN